MNAQPHAFDTALPECVLELPQAGQLSYGVRANLLEAAVEVDRCQRALAKAGLNVVGELLKGHDGFYEMNHYPADDVYDRDSHAQYYYHAHREGAVEHGHFHTFLRAPGIPEHLQPLTAAQASEPWPQGDEAIAHLIGVSMDAWGQPIGLFACNRWVTGETWYPAEAVQQMLPAFSVDHAYPSWPANLWLSALLKLFRPQIEALLEHRDRVIDCWQAKHAGQDVFEDRALEITGYLPISVDDWRQALQRAQAAESCPPSPLHGT